MLYTIAESGACDQAATAEGSPHVAAGASIWETRGEAEQYLTKGQSVYGVDVVPGETTGHSGFPTLPGARALKVARPILSEFHFSSQDIERAFSEPVEGWVL